MNQDDERRARSVCTIGQTIAEAMYPGESPVGKELRIQQTTCRVVGVMTSKGASFGADQDDIVLLPYSAFARKIAGTERIGALLLSARSADRIEDVKRQVSAILRRRRHILAGEEDNFAVRESFQPHRSTCHRRRYRESLRRLSEIGRRARAVHHPGRASIPHAQPREVRQISPPRARRLPPR